MSAWLYTILGNLWEAFKNYSSALLYLLILLGITSITVLLIKGLLRWSWLPIIICCAAIIKVIKDRVVTSGQ